MLQTDERTILYINKNAENYLFQSDLKLGQESTIINIEKDVINNSQFLEEESDEISETTDNVCHAKKILLKKCVKTFKTEEEKEEIK